MHPPARNADLEWVRQNSVHRILDSLARDIISCRPADVLMHVVQWALRQVEQRKTVGGTPVTCDACVPAELPPAQASPIAQLPVSDGPANGTTTPGGHQRVFTEGDPGTPAESPLVVLPGTRRGSRRGSHQGSVAPPVAEDVPAPGERRKTPPRSATVASEIQPRSTTAASETQPPPPPATVGEEESAPAPPPPPEIDDAPHQHKWDPEAPVDWRPSPQQLGERYENPKGLLKFVGEIDAGHYGRVYEVRRLSDDRRLAVKKVPIEGDWVELEIHNLKHCRCDWVVSLVDAYYSPDEDRLWIAMERVGASLAMVAEAAHEKFTEPCIAEICRQVLCALQEIHKRQRVHLDVKPGNLLVGCDGNLRLADFGTMQTIGDKCEQLGDFAFMAPEVAYSVGDYRGESDIWSCGITCLYLADGEAPLANDKPELLMYVHKETCLTPRLWEPDKWSPELNQLLGTCFMKDAAKRPSAEQALAHPWVAKYAASPLVLPPPLGPRAHKC
eukprot:TRINITY_DN2985_c0_g1_i1.p1 TRINITY_DN2985_c0_g1~~TRINITY_DN2985_c0_g1_i1.p1  ORF type:complete len:501 (+),score=117.32 TRINITY_DN2985_c0_g1_i1:96-1598(+)